MDGKDSENLIDIFQMKKEGEREGLEYSKKMGSFKPHFQGKPQDYYELDGKEIASAVGVCVLIVVFFFFLAVAMFFWSHNVSTSNLVLVWSIVLIVFVPVFMASAYYGSNNKMEVEEKLIKEALKRIVDKKERRNARDGNDKKVEEEEKHELSMSSNKIMIQADL